jgi:restriction endonuclease S subunit
VIFDKNVELAQTPLGLLPRHWDIKTFEKVCEKPEYGFTESATAEPVGPKFLRITDIQDGRVNWATVPFCKCPEELKPKYLLKPGDLLVARIGATTGKTYYITECPEAVYASYLIRLRPSTVDGRFLYYFCNSDLYWQQINAGKGEKLKGGVSGGSLAQLLVCVPPPDEQKEIADLLVEIDSVIRLQSDRLDLLNELRFAAVGRIFGLSQQEGVSPQEQNPIVSDPAEAPAHA